MNPSSPTPPVDAAAATLDPAQTHVVAEWQHGKPLISCRFHPGGKYLVTASEDRSLQRWDLATGQKVVLAGHESWPRGIAFAGKWLITSGCDDRLIWWDLEAEQPQPVKTVEAHKGWIRSIAISPDGQWLASGGNDRLVKLWNVEDGALVAELAGHQRDVYSTLFHPDGKQLLSGDLMGQVIHWELPGGKQLRTFDAQALHTYNGGQGVDYGGIRSLSLSPDGQRLACGGLHKASNPLGAVNEPLVLLFNWDDQKLVKSQVADDVKGVVWRAQFHSTGLLVAASGGSGGGFLLFWKADEEKAFHKLKLPNTARELDLHPDGLQLATAHHDGKVRISRMTKKA